MTNYIDSTKDVLWVAIDIAKYTHVVLVEYPNKTRKKLTVQNQLEDFEKLRTILMEPKLPVYVAFEPTADYHRNLAYFLKTSGFTCHFVSSIAVARTREALFNTWDKNDPKDAQVILQLLKAGNTQVYHDPIIHQYNDVQELSNTYHQVSKRKTRVYHSLVNHYLPLYFPEIEKYLCSSRGIWLIQFLLVFPTPLSITQHPKEVFVKLGSVIPGYKRFKNRWLSELYETAKKSVGLPSLETSVAIEMFKKTLLEYLHLCQSRESIEKQAANYLTEQPDYQLLQSIPGIGPIIALTLLSETGNIRRFSHVKQFINFCGFNLCAKQSGTFRGQAHISKRGNARLRQVLWMAGQVAVTRTENTFRKKFDAFISKNGETPDNKRKAYTAIAIKMARVIYAVLTKRTDYQGHYEPLVTQ